MHLLDHHARTLLARERAAELRAVVLAGGGPHARRVARPRPAQLVRIAVRLGNLQARERWA